MVAGANAVLRRFCVYFHNFVFILQKMTAIVATSYTYRSLADGTLAVTLHIEPQDVAAYLELCRMPGTPLALARLVQEHEKRPEVPRETGKTQKASVIAFELCKNREFWGWINKYYDGGNELGFAVATELAAANFIKEYLQIVSRKDLDTHQGHAALFLEQIVKPYNEWKKAKMMPTHNAVLESFS
jgi:hypothetical protein